MLPHPRYFLYRVGLSLSCPISDTGVLKSWSRVEERGVIRPQWPLNLVEDIIAAGGVLLGLGHCTERGRGVLAASEGGSC